MDDRPGYGVDEDVVVNAAGDGTDLIHGVEAGLHRLAWLLTLLCRRLLSGCLLSLWYCPVSYTHLTLPTICSV